MAEAEFRTRLVWPQSYLLSYFQLSTKVNYLQRRGGGRVRAFCIYGSVHWSSRMHMFKCTWGQMRGLGKGQDVFLFCSLKTSCPPFPASKEWGLGGPTTMVYVIGWLWAPWVPACLNSWPNVKRWCMDVVARYSAEAFSEKKIHFPSGF